MSEKLEPTRGNTHSSHWGAFRTRVEGGRLTAVTAFERDPDPSPILQSIPDAIYAPSRVAQPAVRAGWLEEGPGGRRERRGAEPFVPVSWERALDLVAAELRRVSGAHGNAAIFGGSYGWSSAGVYHHAQGQLQRFLSTIGGYTGKVNTYSIAAGEVIVPHVLGSGEHLRVVTGWESIIAHTRLMVLFGGLPLRNTEVKPGGSGHHPVPELVRRAVQAGVQFVVVDPVRGEAADGPPGEWIAPRPNTDTALMLGLAHTLASEGLHDRAFLERYCTGYERFEAYLLGRTDGQPKDARWASAITEVDAEAIRALARRMAATRTMIAANWALQRGDHGEQPFWMLVTLAAMLGQIGLPGGGFGFGYGSAGGIGEPLRRFAAPRLTALPNPTQSWIPVARITDMLLHPQEPYAYNGQERRYPDIRLVYWCGGNPFHHHQDLNRLRRAWSRPETIVVHEPWWTATARHADIVLPATTTLERNDVGASSRDTFIMAMKQAIAPFAQARNDADIFAALAGRLGTLGAFREGRDEMGWLRHLYDTARAGSIRQGVELPTFDAFWEQGFVELPPDEAPLVMLADFRADPQGHALKTPSGRIELYSETIAGFGYADCPGHPAWQEPAEWLGSPAARRFPLHLLSNQPATRLHSQMDPGRLSQASKVNGREPIRLHPRDAAARGIRAGDVVRVFNERGEVLAGAVLTDAIRPGVVQLSTGAWYNALDPAHPASLETHGNPNVLTLDKGTSRLAQGPSAQSALVEIEPYRGEAPPVSVFEPPALLAADDGS
jgi:biotin/methionine sulfoxide reductase